MITILYTTDFEPINVVDIPLDVLEKGEKTGFIRLALKEKSDPTKYSKFIDVNCQKVTWFDGSTKIVHVTENEEHALMLKPDWVVGQKALIRAYQGTFKKLLLKLKKPDSDYDT